MDNVSRFARISGLAVLIAVFAGCASNQELESIRMMAEQAQADASAARQAAEEARAAAREAADTSRATDEKINRMFRRSMQK